MKRLLASSSLLRSSCGTHQQQRRRWPASSVYRGWPSAAAAAAAAGTARRGIFQYLWRPKAVDIPPPKNPHAGHGHKEPHHAHRSQLWGAKAAVGSLNPPPQRAAEDLITKLEKAHYCTQELRAEGLAAAAASSSSASAPQQQEKGKRSKPFILVPTYVPVGLDPPVRPLDDDTKAVAHHHQNHHNHHHHHHHHHDAPLRFGEEADDAAAMTEAATPHAPSTAHWNPGLQQHLDELIHQHFSFRLRRLPSTIPGAGMGLFLTSGRVEAGAVLTCYPGLLYRIPYDLEVEMPMDEVSLTPCPPEFLVKNDYLLRFEHEPTGQHFLLDGCPRGISALNYIKASQRRAKLGSNLDWLESTASACELRHPALGEHGQEECQHLTGDGGKGLALLIPSGPETEPLKYFKAAMGLGHLTQGAATEQQHGYRRTTGKQPAGGVCTEGAEQGGTTAEDTPLNDPGDSGAQHNAEFHLLELPRDVPPHLLKYLPNLAYSDACDRQLVVLVTASRDMEVAEGQPPIEIFVPYTQHASCRPGFPLM